MALRARRCTTCFKISPNAETRHRLDDVFEKLEGFLFSRAADGKIARKAGPHDTVCTHAPRLGTAMCASLFAAFDHASGTLQPGEPDQSGIAGG
ncbi:hypothetical protein [Roseivivax sediminis]|uniref:hypothetical protein n=1 Tax=Roseivivax sediminis TaxID=936889 RepID=UPI00122CFC10|nr:hypothetical protein [Roseivivax sediminis]